MIIRWMVGITRSAPDEVAVALPGGKIERMRVEPEERLTGAAEFGHLVEDEPDRLLDPAVRILLQPIAGLDEADRCGDDQLAPARLLVTRRQRALPQEIELVLIETALEAEEQPVIALAQHIDRLPVDEHRVDHAAHLDQLLPITAVAGEARHLPSRDRADLAGQTSATIRSKPARVTLPAAERPRSSSMIAISDQPRPVRRSRIAYCSARLSRLCST